MGVVEPSAGRSFRKRGEQRRPEAPASCGDLVYPLAGPHAPATLSHSKGGFGFRLVNDAAFGAVADYAPYGTMEHWGAKIPTGSPGGGAMTPIQRGSR